MLGLAAVLTAAARFASATAEERAQGGDRVTATRIVAAILAARPPAQVTHVRCERINGHRACGIVVDGVKFKRLLTLAAWNAEITGLVERAFASAPDLEEVDCWAVVPLDAGRGVIVSGDYAKPTSATVFSITVPRVRRGRTAARLRESGTDVFWDPAFRTSLAKGTRG